jgi:hypothetical protein
MSGSAVSADGANANPFLIDPDTLTLGEMTALWEITGLETIELLMRLGDGSAAVHPALLMGLQFIAGRRVDPTYTLVDAGAVRLVDLGVSDG